ncbi:MAG: MFS transporter [Gammaproteobacteria bacterium]|nr:MAG: MFS transporter [Gammaproteobacteria bacterium]TLZ07851.1 MAG: MFS transporter [Gammaproteobacteria bacterium]TLZ18708.1 MAG: MFS transporter [Gammaproteobacteria bacterium]
MTGRDPKSIIDDGAMAVGQWVAVLVTLGLNAMDGFDVLSISFASPGIARDWGIDKATLGWVLSMELLGMALGSLLLGGVADKVGRRPTILGCLVAMAIGMSGAGHAQGVAGLLVWRLLTGLGIGGTLAAINAAAAEVSNRRWRNFAMALMVIGYPLGGIVGGMFVQRLLATATWHEVFLYGAWATSGFLPIVWLLVPESVAFLDRRRPPGALQRINRILVRFGHPPVSVLSEASPGAERRSIADLFKPGLLTTTVLITFVYFAHITSFYFIIKWVPKIVVDMGFEPRAAAGVLIWANVGGAVGGAIFGLIATRLGLKALTLCVLLATSVMIVWFGHGSADLATLKTTLAITGLFTNSAIAGLYLLFAQVFPTHVRASGTGFAIGVGRGGAVLAPVAAGYLFHAGFALQTVALAMASGSLLAAVALLALRVRDAD